MAEKAGKKGVTIAGAIAISVAAAAVVGGVGYGGYRLYDYLKDKNETVVETPANEEEVAETSVEQQIAANICAQIL